MRNFENRCGEDKTLVLQDGTEKIFYNCTCPGGNIPEELKALYEYIRDGKVKSLLTEKLETAVNRVKRNEKWRGEYMKELTIYDDLKAEIWEDAKSAGRAEGRAEGLHTVIRNLSYMKLPPEQIAEAVNMKKEDVLKYLSEDGSAALSGASGK